MWTAEFRGGPMDGPESDRTFMAPVYPDRIWFAKVDPRAQPGAGTRDGWVLIGMEGFPPNPPWPEQAEYKLDREASTLEKPPDWQPGEDEGHAVFVYVEEKAPIHYTIYESPKDFPDSFVVRRWRIVRDADVGARAVPDEHVIATADTLEEARGYVPVGLFCIPRAESDNPVIVETWT